MGIFSEADHHPFIQRDDLVVEQAHGGAAESWRDENSTHEYVRPAYRPSGLLIRADELAA